MESWGTLVALRGHSPPELGWGAGACTLFQTEICYFPPIHTYFNIQLLYYFQCLLPFHCISQTPFLEKWTIKKPPQLQAGCWARGVCFTLFMGDSDSDFRFFKRLSSKYYSMYPIGRLRAYLSPRLSGWFVKLINKDFTSDFKINLPALRNSKVRRNGNLPVGILESKNYIEQLWVTDIYQCNPPW